MLIKEDKQEEKKVEEVPSALALSPNESVNLKVLTAMLGGCPPEQ